MISCECRSLYTKREWLRRELQNSLGRQSVAAAFELYRTIDEYGGIDAVRGVVKRLGKRSSPLMTNLRINAMNELI